MNTALKVETWPIDRLREYARNPRKNDDQVDRMVAAIREFGFRIPVVAKSDGLVVDGHLRLKAARKLGMTEIPVALADELSDAQIKAFRLLANRSANWASWDDGLLRLELQDIASLGFNLNLTGFSDKELAALSVAPNAGLTDPDDAPPAPERPVSVLGDVWLLGRHRLLCGDSMDGAAIARLMESERAALLFTSPPYGNQRNYTTGGIGDWEALMRGVFGRLDDVMAQDGQVLVNLGMIHRDNEWQPYWNGWLDWMRASGWRRFGFYVWDQGPGLPGDWNGRLAPAFELLFHFNRQMRKPNKIVPCKWAGHINDSHGGMRGKDGTVGEWTHAGQGVQETRIPDNVLRITRHKARGIETEHPAVFPVALPEFVMNTYCDQNDIVFEPFAGSGTTLVAGERAGRRVRAIELAPEYVDVALLRWRQLFPSSAVVLDGDGQSFEAVAAERGIEIDDAA